MQKTTMTAVRNVLAAVAAAVLCFAAGLTNPASAAAAESDDTLAAGDRIPVLAWGSIPWGPEATPARYAELAGAGFTHTFSSGFNADTMQKALDLAHAAGLKHFVAIPELERDPEGTAKRFKDHPGIGGYYLRDEPGADLFAQLGAWAKRIQSVDKVNPVYVNLFPTYGNPGMWNTPDYATYVDRFVKEVPTPMLSFDHYPVHCEGKDASGDRVRPDFYYNLEVCSAAARKSGRPLWAFALATAHNPYPIPTAAHLRLQVFSNLAYGAQTIQYFTYWTVKSDVWNFHQGPIEVDGTRTPTYDRVKQMNEELQALRGAFLGSKVISVGHTGATIPHGTTRYAPSGAVKSLDTPGGGAVVSLLEKGASRYLAVVNRDLHKPVQLNIAFDAAANVSQAAKDGKLTAVKGASHASAVEPGDVIVFTWVAK